MEERKKISIRNPNSLSREFAMQFLYQCERERIAFFPEGNFSNFADHFGVPANSWGYTRFLAEGTLNNLANLDEKIVGVSENWSISRMGATDRCILRLATFELANSETPRKVIINEAIDLAKKYGSENSGSFVNGILDKLVSKVPSESEETAIGSVSPSN